MLLSLKQRLSFQARLALPQFVDQLHEYSNKKEQRVSSYWKKMHLWVRTLSKRVLMTIPAVR